MANTAAMRQRQDDLTADDLSPACPHCGDLCNGHAVICQQCGTKLFDGRTTLDDDAAMVSAGSGGSVGGRVDHLRRAFRES